MSPKKKGKQARSRYMIAEFTPQERKRVVQHCEEAGVTISGFLAGVALEEVNRAQREGSMEEQITITLTIPAEQNAKLQMFANRRGKTVDQFVVERLTPTLEQGKTSFRANTASLRYYVSPDQHQLLKKFFKSKNLSARTYVSYLALKELERKKKKK